GIPLLEGLGQLPRLDDRHFSPPRRRTDVPSRERTYQEGTPPRSGGVPGNGPERISSLPLVEDAPDLLVGGGHRFFGRGFFARRLREHRRDHERVEDLV